LKHGGLLENNLPLAVKAPKTHIALVKQSSIQNPVYSLRYSLVTLVEQKKKLRRVAFDVD
jgi:hypothetical protein